MSKLSAQLGKLRNVLESAATANSIVFKIREASNEAEIAKKIITQYGDIANLTDSGGSMTYNGTNCAVIEKELKKFGIETSSDIGESEEAEDLRAMLAPAFEKFKASMEADEYDEDELVESCSSLFNVYEECMSSKKK